MKKLKNLLLSFVLLITAKFLVSLVGVCTFIIYSSLTFFTGRWGKLASYWYRIAVSEDQNGNVVCGPFLNLTFIHHLGYKFGNMDETVSSAMGKNEEMETLTKFGRFIGNVLNKLDPNHLKKSIEENP